MAEIRMPSLGADMQEGTLVEWKVAVGDHVARGDVVGLVETQKATMEIESFVEGVVEELVVAAGTKVPVGAALARVRSAVEPVAAPPRVETAPAAVAQPRTRSSPAARKLARERGIELSSVAGTGPSGAVILRDVPSAPTTDLAPLVERVVRPPVASPMREAIAAAMSRSKREIPHYYLAHTISLQRALAWLAALNATRSIHDRVLPGALLLRAVVRGLWEVPELNGAYVDGAFRPSESVHLGMAIALRTGGVIAPAIRDAEELSVEELMAALRDVVTRARTGHLRTGELVSATVTVTSLGERGCDSVWPVINPPQVAMIGFGTIVPRPWVDGAAVAVHPTVIASLAADHRVTDGHRGARFLAAIDRFLQEPS